MTLVASCPRCGDAVVAEQARWTCPLHGDVPPLWTPETPDYTSFVEYLDRTGDLPTWVPWPLAEGGAVVDFGAVVGDGGPRAAYTTVLYPSERDGVVEITVITEEPEVGLGSRCAGLGEGHPAPEVGSTARAASVMIAGHPIALWAVSSLPEDPTLDRSTFLGEAHGRWLWLVFKPASAALLLLDSWVLEDISGMGLALLELPFRSAPRGW